MGEVSQAIDRKLGRIVAIKVLPAGLEGDVGRVARFHREAKLLASLNHPNIAAIHSLEEFEGTQFLVLELVEGETLPDRLKHGQIPAAEALKLALQIAEALESAHAKGVIHRDFKPANIKITPGGKVKVLDFGLAKALGSVSSGVHGSDCAGESDATTEMGIIMGTASYMSPEQARGMEVDSRCDIWAFGVVLCYARAWAALAATEASQASFGYVPVEESYPKALASVNRSLALDADTASAYAVLGWIQMTYKWDWAEADTSFQRALALGSGKGMLEAAQLALALGRMEQALMLARRAVDIDALNDSANMSLALIAYYAGLFEEACASFKKALELSPDRANAHALLAEVFLAQSRLPEALAEAEKEKDSYWRLPELSLIYFALGRKEESNACLSKFIGDYHRVGAFQIAQVYAFRGETDLAFEWLEKAYDQHDGGLFLTKTNPLLRKLNHDPRFTVFLRKMNLPPDSS